MECVCASTGPTVTVPWFPNAHRIFACSIRNGTLNDRVSDREWLSGCVCGECPWHRHSSRTASPEAHISLPRPNVGYLSIAEPVIQEKRTNQADRIIREERGQSIDLRMHQVLWENKTPQISIHENGPTERKPVSLRYNQGWSCGVRLLPPRTIRRARRRAKVLFLLLANFTRVSR